MHDDGVFDKAAAERYDESSAAMFAPEVLGPTVDFLAEVPVAVDPNAGP